MNKKAIVPLFLALLFFCGGHTIAKTINVPSVSIESAIENAKRYVQENKINLTDAFIGVVEYHNLHNEYERPYWRVRWVRKIGAKGGWFELRFFSDGSVEERPGK